MKKRLIILALCLFSIISYANSPITIGYYASWSAYHGYKPNEIPAKNLDIINYAFGNICYPGSTQNGCENTKACHIAMADPYIDNTNFEELAKLEGKYPHLKVVYSIGGWNNSKGFYHCTQDEESRQALASSMKTFLEIHSVLDGIDLDWEFPVQGGESDQPHSPDDRENYAELLKMIRAAIGKDYLLSIAGPPAETNNAKISDMPLDVADDVLDFVNMMAYDYHGVWETKTNHLAPLRSDDQVNIESAVSTYIELGVPAEKLVLGFPFYGLGWKVNNPSSSETGLYQDASALHDPNPDAGANFTYKTILNNQVKPGKGKVYWDEKSQSSVFYNNKTGTFFSFNGPKDAQVKADFIKQKGLRGAMYWELSQDACEEDSLSYQMSQALGRDKTDIMPCPIPPTDYNLEITNLSKSFGAQVTIADGDKWYTFDYLHPEGKGQNSMTYSPQTSSSVEALQQQIKLKVKVDFAGKTLWCNKKDTGTDSHLNADKTFDLKGNMHIMVKPRSGTKTGDYKLACSYAALPDKSLDAKYK